MAEVTVRYWAAAKDAAGIAGETVCAETLADVFSEIIARHGAGGRLAVILACSSILVDETRANKAAASSIALESGSCVEVLPPFAGG